MIFQANIVFLQPCPAPSSSLPLWALICLFTTHKRHVPSTFQIALTKHRIIWRTFGAKCVRKFVLTRHQAGRQADINHRGGDKGVQGNYKLTDIIVIKLSHHSQEIQRSHIIVPPSSSLLQPYFNSYKISNGFLDYRRFFDINS